MNIDQFFNLAVSIAGIGWIILLFVSPFWPHYNKVVGGIVAVIIAASYTALNVLNFRTDLMQKFSTLDGVMELFSSKPIVTAAWCHILCFDLLVAVWIKRDSVKRGISHWKIIPALVFTCLLGPLGFLIYMATRWLCTGRYFPQSSSAFVAS